MHLYENYFDPTERSTITTHGQQGVADDAVVAGDIEHIII